MLPKFQSGRSYIKHRNLLQLLTTRLFGLVIVNFNLGVITEHLIKPQSGDRKVSFITGQRLYVVWTELKRTPTQRGIPSETCSKGKDESPVEEALPKALGVKFSGNWRRDRKVVYNDRLQYTCRLNSMNDNLVFTSHSSDNRIGTDVGFTTLLSSRNLYSRQDSLRHLTQ